MKKFLLKVINVLMALIGFCKYRINTKKQLNIMEPVSGIPFYVFDEESNPIFMPKKHTKMTYSQVRRVAKKRRQKRKYGYK